MKCWKTENVEKLSYINFFKLTYPKRWLLFQVEAIPIQPINIKTIDQELVDSELPDEHYLLYNMQ